MTEHALPEDRVHAHDHAREQLSSLMDGDGTSDSVAAACRHWHQDADARAQWHTYHLIGDVLRSEDLCRRSGADAEFLRAVRERLVKEPVVLAPAATRRTPLRLRRWVAPVGMAAGVALVAGAVLVIRPGGVSDHQTIATLARPGHSAPRTPAPPGPSATDAELVRYLEAHQQFPGTPALGPAPGFLRSAAYAPTPSR